MKIDLIYFQDILIKLQGRTGISNGKQERIFVGCQACICESMRHYPGQSGKRTVTRNNSTTE